MPFRKLEMKESRMQFVVRAASGAESLSELCREFGISRPTGRKWRDRYLACGTLAHLGELSRRPHSSPRRSAPERERQVLELRQRYGWGARKLQRLLQESGVRYPATTVHRILKRHGLVNVNAPRPALQRFERPRPNQLWQMDGKGPLKSLDGICQPLSILDDHSRYAVGLHALRVLRREPIQACLQQTFEQAGLPEAMLMDRGHTVVFRPQRARVDGAVGVVDQAGDSLAVRGGRGIRKRRARWSVFTARSRRRCGIEAGRRR